LKACPLRQWLLAPWREQAGFFQQLWFLGAANFNEVMMRGTFFANVRGSTDALREGASGPK
jgi:hypothetical protein